MHPKQSFRARLLLKWDWIIYRLACGSLRRMTTSNPGMSYLMELNLRDWNKHLGISPSLKAATEAFHESMKNHRK
jgi:hypothetical protein